MLHNLVMVIVLVVLLGLSAFFSGSETALMAISRLRLHRLSEVMPRRVAMVEKILENPERLIGTILLGNNLVNVAMSAIATVLAIMLWGEKGIIYVTVIMTLLILIFAEITPKVYAKYFNERVSLFVAPVMSVAMAVSKPVIGVITFISTEFLLLIGIDVKKVKRPLFTEAELQSCIKMAWDDGTITADERSLLGRVFALNDMPVQEIMIPFNNMTVIDVESPINRVIDIVMKTGYSRFPVSQGERDNIIGFLHAKDMLKLIPSGRGGSVKKLIRPPYFIEVDKTIDAQLRSFQARRLHQAVILSKQGRPLGLITLEDIMEQLVGAIRDEYDR